MRLAGLCALLLLLASPALAVDVSQLSDFESNPCFQALSDRNVAQHVGAPDSAMVEACERAHDSVEVAWDFLTRVWLPRDVPVSAAVPGAPLNPAALVLTLLEMLLAYAVIATPIWAVGAAPRAERPRAVMVLAVLCLAVRLVLAAALLVLLRLPAATLLAAALLVVVVARAVRAGPRSRAENASRCGAFALILAGVINDAAAASPGVLALALAARGHGWLLMSGVLLAVPFALPPPLRLLLAVRRSRLGLVVAAALLALAIGSLALSDPALTGRASLGLAVPVVCVAVVLWQARGLRRPAPRPVAQGPSME